MIIRDRISNPPAGVSVRAWADDGGLVERSATACSAAETWNLIVLQRELVIVGHLLVDVYVALGVNHDLLQRINGNHLGVTVRL